MLFENKLILYLNRTSGEVRLSDFLLWQSCFSVTHFAGVLWPEFTMGDLLAGVFHYQRNRRGIAGLLPASRDAQSCDDAKRRGRLEQFSQWLSRRERNMESDDGFAVL